MSSTRGRVRVPIVAFIVLAAGGASAQEGPRTAAAARTGPITVTYRSQTSVYVSAGRSAGLQVGDRLAVRSGEDKAAELEIVFLAENSSSCKVVSETRPVKPGDRLVRLGPTRAAAPAPAAAAASREFTVKPANDPAPATYGATRRAAQ